MAELVAKADLAALSVQGGAREWPLRTVRCKTEIEAQYMQCHFYCSLWCEQVDERRFTSDEKRRRGSEIIVSTLCCPMKLDSVPRWGNPSGHLAILNLQPLCPPSAQIVLHFCTELPAPSHNIVGRGIAYAALRSTKASDHLAFLVHRACKYNSFRPHNKQC